jgi:tetratricopeptide (TPR) repeat protein
MRLTVLAWVFLVCSPVFAQSQVPAPGGGSGESAVPEDVEAAARAAEEDDKARTLFQAGKIAYESGEYGRALDLFRAAYNQSQRPALLFNIASSADRLRFDEEAIDAYERYLADVPQAKNKIEVQKRIEILRAEIARKERDRALREAQANANAQVGSPTSVSASAPAAEQPTKVDKPWHKRWWVWTLGGVVVAGVATAAVLATRDSGSEPSEPVVGDKGIVTFALGRE